MAYDEDLAARVHDAMPPEATEKRMFGGLAFLIGGNLAVAVGDGDLMIRVGADAAVDAVEEPGARPCVMGQRTMKAWVLIDVADLAQSEDLQTWVDRGAAFARTLPPK